MKEIQRVYRMYSLVYGLLLCMNVAVFGQEAKTNEPAHVGAIPGTHQDLTSLPLPKEKIVVAVYKFTDQTGQFKSSNLGQSWSTAVTQGATSMLIKALEDSKWFIPVERDGLSNLLNERKIISTTRESYAKETQTEAKSLPPLLFASIILEGGIVSYESNLVTRGAGLRYFGVGGTVSAQKDQVTVFLRAVSTKNGQVLKTVHATKSILSRMVDVGIYQFVGYKRLLEAEVGFSFNEPPQLCVNAAIEKAVMSLIIEGCADSLWALGNPLDSSAEVVTSYWHDKSASQKGMVVAENIEHQTLFQISVGNQSENAVFEFSPQPIGTIGCMYRMTPQWYSGVSLQAGFMNNNLKSNSRMLSFNTRFMYEALPENEFSINIAGGISAINTWPRDSKSIPIQRNRRYFLGFEPGVNAAVLLRFAPNEIQRWYAEVERIYSFTNDLDGKKQISGNDGFWALSIGTYIYTDAIYRLFW